MLSLQDEVTKVTKQLAVSCIEEKTAEVDQKDDDNNNWEDANEKVFMAKESTVTKKNMELYF
jgi:hypothetical protein